MSLNNNGGNNGSVAHETNTVGDNSRHMDDENGRMEPRLWAEMLGSEVVRKLVVYAQKYYLQQRWVNSKELANEVNVSENSVYKYMDDVLLLGIYEQSTEGQTTVYRPRRESYILHCFDDIEATIRNNLSEGERI